MNVVDPLTQHLEHQLATITRESEAAACRRIDAHHAARRAATGPVELAAADLAALEAELSESTATRARIAELCVAAQAQIDVELGPLRTECFRLTEGHDNGETANRLRARRDMLVNQRALAGRPLLDHDRQHDGYIRSLQGRIADARGNLAKLRSLAAFEAQSDATLEKLTKDCHFRLQVRRSNLSGAKERLAHYRRKLADAHAVTETEEGLVVELAEAVGEKEALQADAFILGKKPEGAKLAEVDRSIADLEKRLERAKNESAGARAAICTLEGKIASQGAEVEEATKRLEEAEGALVTAMGDLRRRLVANAEAEHKARLQMINAALAAYHVPAVGGELVAEEL